LEIVSIDEGIQIDCSAEHLSNADSGRFEIWQPCSNAKCEIVWQDLKQELEMSSIDEGMQID
jgi:hypothetical protein